MLLGAVVWEAMALLPGGWLRPRAAGGPARAGLRASDGRTRPSRSSSPNPLRIRTVSCIRHYSRPVFKLVLSIAVNLLKMVINTDRQD